MRQAAALTSIIRTATASAALAVLAACGGGGDSTAAATDKSFKGTVTSFDNAQSFSVDGIPVDASGANATAQGLSTGSRVEIEGEMVNGTIQARRVEFDDDSATDDSRSDPNELDGRVTAYNSPTSFSVDGIPVDASAAPMTLTVGMHVEIHGTISNGTMVASSVKIEGRSGDDASRSDDDRNDDNCTTSTAKSSCESEKDDDSEDHKDSHDDNDKDDDKSESKR
ncbi:MAG: hypothetical protein KDF54_13810 [Hydrogenophaga sp.]|nr:hypothetical protein [Hydrogenophaga sp.]